MPINRLDHVNLRTTQLSELVAWYRDVLGLHEGWRPDFGFPGAWLYAGEHAVIHLVEIDSAPAVGSEAALKLEHFAFTATDAPNFEATLQRLGVDYRKNEVPSAGTVAYNIWDPDGNHIHVDFDTKG